MAKLILYNKGQQYMYRRLKSRIREKCAAEIL